MISSLANFFMLIFYHGGQPQGAAWTLLMFTMGAVGIARVAIEQDRGYSLGYAGILGVVTFVVMLRFVDSAIFTFFILVLIGYLSDRIVHDCTLIDDKVDASGQGLIDSGRLFVKKRIESRVQPDANQADSGGEAVKATPTGKRNQPGRTVLYLALAALPLFGLGQFFLRDNDDTWRRAQFLLALYLFSSLSLLVTTSFLGLRRYLRQRKVDMPKNVSVAWLAGGMAMIALILMIAYLAPLPGKALASFELTSFLDSPGGLTASKLGWGDEAADESDPSAPSTQNDPLADDKEIQSVTPQEGAQAGDAGEGKREDGPTGNEQGGKKEPAQGEGPDQGESQSKSESQTGGEKESQSSKDSKSGEQSSQQPGKEPQQQQGDSPDSSESESGQPKQDPKSEADSSQQDRDAESKSEEPGSPPDAKQQTEQNESQSNSAASKDKGSAEKSDSGVSEAISNAVPMLSGIIRLIVFLGLLAIVAAFLWMNRHAFFDWWQRLMQGKSSKDAGDSFDEFLASESRVPPRSFSSYRNPFGNEQDPRRIVVITFQAFEAWTREQGSTRGKDETPSEFIRRIAKTLPNVSAAASQVVESYNRIAYGRGNASEHDLSAAKKVWNAMQSA